MPQQNQGLVGVGRAPNTESIASRVNLCLEAMLAHPLDEMIHGWRFQRGGTVTFDEFDE
jgi:hypothetical protein